MHGDEAVENSKFVFRFGYSAQTFLAGFNAAHAPANKTAHGFFFSTYL